MFLESKNEDSNCPNELYSKIDPHITLAFPFKNEMTNEELKQNIPG